MPDHRWVRRNEDKPHRCPDCHSIADRARWPQSYGPRTQMACPAPSCGARWRIGSRARREPMRLRALLNRRESRCEH